MLVSRFVSAARAAFLNRPGRRRTFKMGGRGTAVTTKASLVDARVEWLVVHVRRDDGAASRAKTLPLRHRVMTFAGRHRRRRSAQRRQVRLFGRLSTQLAAQLPHPIIAFSRIHS